MSIAERWQTPDLRSDPLEPEFRGDPVDLWDALGDLMRAVERPAWHTLAACRGQGPAQWFPARGADQAVALAVCAGCPVRQECEAAGLAESCEAGIWGGLSGRKRKAIRNGRRARSTYGTAAGEVA